LFSALVTTRACCSHNVYILDMPKLYFLNKLQLFSAPYITLH